MDLLGCGCVDSQAPIVWDEVVVLRSGVGESVEDWKWSEFVCVLERRVAFGRSERRLEMEVGVVSIGG